jgi:hypothetical protein
LIEFCWGQKYIPLLILEEDEQRVIVFWRGAAVPMQKDTVLGRCKLGDPVMRLTVGGRWIPSKIESIGHRVLRLPYHDSYAKYCITLIDGDGKRACLQTLKTVRKTFALNAPSAALNSGVFALGETYFVLGATAPLEWLNGKPVTLQEDGPNLCRVAHAGRSLLLRRECLHAQNSVTPAEPPESSELFEQSSELLEPLRLHQMVTSSRAYVDQVGEIVAIEGELAYVKYGDRPVYPVMCSDLTPAS